MARVTQWIIVFWLMLETPFWFAGTIAVIMLWYDTAALRRNNDRKPQHNHRPAYSTGPSSELVQLALLRQWLRQASRDGQFDTEEYVRITRTLDALDEQCCSALMIPETDRRQALEAAWQLLEAQTGGPLITPPWRRTASETGAETQQEMAPGTALEPQVANSIENPWHLTPTVLVPKPTDSTNPTRPLRQKPEAEPEAAHGHRQPQLRPPEPAASEHPSNPTPKPPPLGRLSKLHRRSRDFLARFLLPFLWQNIGWFIGGFCFVSGSVFLVTYTTGFTKSLVVVSTLTLYGLLLFWGGYRIRHKRPQLITASQVLIALGMLLIPLVFAAATRLIATALTSPWLLLTALAAGLTVLSLFSVAARLGSGLMDRTLLGQHSRLFIMLAAVQFATPLLIALPLLTALPPWPILAVLLIALFCILIHAIRRFSRHWLHSLFVDRRRLTYYAAGTLVYAALVSFVHLTWGSQVTLPAGYSGPFLMALCGLLFYIDLHVKRWVKKDTWLSHINFIIYALSTVALLSGVLPYQSSTAAFWPLVLMLSISSVLYASMVWHYLSLPPLYLLLGSLSALYALLILRPFPEATHFVLSLPGLYGLLLMRTQALRRESAALAQVIQRLLLALIPSLTLWVLYHATPGWTAMVTPLTALLATLVTLGIIPERIAPKQMTAEHHKSVTIGNAGYLLTGLAILTLAFAPLLPVPWSLQFSIALLGLAGLWTRLAASELRRTSPRCQAVVLINSALLSLMAATGFAFTTGVMPFFSSLLAAAGGVLLWLGLALRSRLLSYGTMLTWAAAAWVLIDHYRITTSGASSLLVAIGIYVLFRWLEHRRPGPVTATGPSTAPDGSWSLRLLWCWPLQSETYPNRTAMLVPPLYNAFSLLWLAGLIKVGNALVAGFSLLSSHEIRLALASDWPGAATLAALVTILQAGRAGLQVWLLPPSMLLMMSVMLAVVPDAHGWQPVLIALYAALIWTLSAYCPAAPPRLLNVLGWHGGREAADQRRLTEHSLHWCAFTLLLGSITAALQGADEPLLATLAIGVAFLWLAGKRYHLQMHAYLVVAGISFGALVLYHQLVDAAFLHRLTPHETALVDAVLAVMLSFWAFRLSGTAGRVSLPRTNATPTVRSTSLYPLPLYHLGYLLYTLALFITVWSALNPFASGSPPAMDRLWQAGLLSLLALALLPVLRPCPRTLPATLSGSAARLRGIMMPLLVSLAFFLLFPDPQSAGIIAWSLALWGTGTLILPRWNAWTAKPATSESYRMPIDSPFCTWLGLVVMLAGFTLQTLQIQPDSPVAASLVGTLPPLLAHTLAPLIQALFSLQQLSMPLLLGLSLYLTLLLHDRQRNALLCWMAAISITLSGLTGLLHWFPLTSGINQAFVVGALLWLNLLLRFGSLWRTGSSAAFRRLLPLARLSTPLWTLAAGLLLIFLLAVSLPTLYMLIHTVTTGSTMQPPKLLTVALSALLTASFAHLFTLKPCRLFAHILLFSLFITTLLILLTGASLSLALVAWTALLLLIPVVLERRLVAARWRLLADTAHAWLTFSFAIALVTWVMRDTPPILERLTTLALLISVALTIGLRTLRIDHPNRGGLWLKGSVLLALLWLHWIGLPWLPVGTSITVLLPWYALEMGCLAWLGYQFAPEHPNRLWLIARDAPSVSRVSTLTSQLVWLAPLLLLLAMAEWLLHAWIYCQSLGRPFLMPTLAGSPDHWAAILAGLLITGLWLRQRHLSGNSLIVAMALTAAALAIYIRLFLAGLAAFSVWDTAALLGAGFVLVILQHLWHPNKTVPTALNHLTLLMPMLALLTMPMQLSSTRASVSLLAVAALYLLMRRNRRNPLPVYLALLVFNLSVYLWIPQLFVTTHLVQLYTIPAATTVLLMLQLHLLELKPKVSNAVRLTALSTLYASGSLDVFLRPDLSIFILTLALSLAGVIVGIALRLRAFLYTGAAFLILNVAGQLVNYYPQQTLGKAIVLMVLGGMITGGMIWFSIQREMVLQRVRIIRADLAEWA